MPFMAWHDPESGMPLIDFSAVCQAGGSHHFLSSDFWNEADMAGSH